MRDAMSHSNLYWLLCFIVICLVCMKQVSVGIVGIETYTSALVQDRQVNKQTDTEELIQDTQVNKSSRVRVKTINYREY